MKTTIDLDEEKLKRLMRMTGLRTRKAAIDFALTEAERIARVESFYREPFYVVPEGETVVDPSYEVAALRELEKPSR
jgi:hypothetical protein